MQQPHNGLIHVLDVIPPNYNSMITGELQITRSLLNLFIPLGLLSLYLASQQY